MITRPTGLTLLDWSTQVVADVGPLLGRIDTFPTWQDWAAQLLNTQDAGLNLPNPYGFVNWIEWAELLCGELA